jgi:hypothetical protein
LRFANSTFDAMAEPLPIARNAATECRLLPQMANRHGLVTGATGTGKTVTLQALAEGLSKIGDAGVPVGRQGHRSGNWARMRAHMPWCHHASPRASSPFSSPQGLGGTSAMPDKPRTWPIRRSFPGERVPVLSRAGAACITLN